MSGLNVTKALISFRAESWARFKAGVKMKPPPEYQYELKPGEDWVTFDELLVIAHPERPVKVVHPGGHLGRTH